MVEANAYAGGAVTSRELTVPGLEHDVFATNMNLFLGSPFHARFGDDLAAQILSAALTGTHGRFTATRTWERARERHNGAMSAPAFPATRRPRNGSSLERPAGAGLFMAAVTAFLWVLEGIDTLLGHALDAFGIRSWDPEGLVGILFAPFLHGGFAHLMSNSVPLLVLGFLILVGAGGVRRLLTATSVSAVTSGLAAWVGSVPNTVTIGASGVVFGWFTYAIMRGWWSRDWKSIAIGVLVLFLYGGIIWGVLPTQAGVSWQGHLGGAVGGVIAASLLHRRAARAAR